MKIVLDTNQLISAILTPNGKRAIILDEVLAGTSTLVTWVPLSAHQRPSSRLLCVKGENK